MTEIELLSWVRGPGFQIATIIFVGGIIIRLLETLLLGRPANLAEARGSAMACGLKTVFTRSVPDAGKFKMASFTIVSGYIFHIGLLVTLFFFAPHILLFKDITGFSWPALPTPIVDALTVVSIIALLAVLVHRLTSKVLRRLTNFEDWLVWFVTIAPLVSGYIAFHRIGMTAPTLLAIHILSVELLMIVFPFTKLMHAFTLFIARYYNGAISGYRGVQS
jgi:nitrate reductase gamma subunit